MKRITIECSEDAARIFLKNLAGFIAEGVSFAVETIGEEDASLHYVKPKVEPPKPERHLTRKSKVNGMRSDDLVISFIKSSQNGPVYLDAVNAMLIGHGFAPNTGNGVVKRLLSNERIEYAALSTALQIKEELPK